MVYTLKSTILFVIFSFLLNAGCAQKAEENEEFTTNQSLEVTATAYNSLREQTKKSNIGIAAWGDTLRPGMKVIAVSRDLIKKGLGHNTKVKIEGLDGIYLVKDKMSKRWEKKIDIYMGLDRAAAINWGKKQVTISWFSEEE